MALYQNDAISINVGERLRELRAINEYSLRALAMKSGLSIHTLSMIEKGKTTPSISTLYKLAEALNVPITYFFNPNNNRRQVIYLRADERTHMPFSRGVFEGLGGENFVGNIEPFLLTLESSANSGPPVMSHTGEEFVFCLLPDAGGRGQGPDPERHVIATARHTDSKLSHTTWNTAHRVRTDKCPGPDHHHSLFAEAVCLPVPDQCPGYHPQPTNTYQAGPNPISGYRGPPGGDWVGKLPAGY